MASLRLPKPPYGISNFAQLRGEGYAYVDKTRFIRVLEERPEPFLLFLRPRRFGKSLWLSVLRHYYDIRLREGWDEMFEGLEIAAQPTAKRSSYRVLEIDFSGIAADSVEEAAEGMRWEVQRRLATFIKGYGLGSAQELEKLRSLPTAADTLAAGLEITGRASTPVMVLIDEYDHFTNELLARNPRDFSASVERGGFVRKFYEALKKGTKGPVRNVFMTGVTPVTLDSLTSGFNIASNVTLEPDLHELMGFTHAEVEALLAQAPDAGSPRIARIMADLEQWYDGYRFVEDQPRLFNSDMVLYYLVHMGTGGSPPKEMLDTNVASDYRTIERTVKLAEGQAQELLDEVLDQGGLSVRLTRQYALARGLHRDDVASLLFYLGLLTVAGAELDGVRLKVPNKVMAELFWDTVRVLRSDRTGFGAEPHEIREAVVALAREGELAPLTGLVEEYLKALLSNRDLRGFGERELKIAFLMLVHAPRIYLVQSEAEMGRGYVDILLLRRPGLPEVWEHALELKYLKTEATDEAVAKAAAQAREQLGGYLDAEGLRDRPRLISWVVVFRGASCVVLERQAASK
jgi:hypothetical protein